MGLWEHGLSPRHSQPLPLSLSASTFQALRYFGKHTLRHAVLCVKCQPLFRNTLVLLIMQFTYVPLNKTFQRETFRNTLPNWLSPDKQICSLMFLRFRSRLFSFIHLKHRLWFLAHMISKKACQELLLLFLSSSTDWESIQSHWCSENVVLRHLCV